MKVEVHKNYKVKFSVEYFEVTEGGMDTETYGEPVETIQAALNLLESARNTIPNYDWIIVCDVSIIIKGEEQYNDYN